MNILFLPFYFVAQLNIVGYEHVKKQIPIHLKYFYK